MFERSGKNAWETHFIWSMEVSVYVGFFCYSCVKCSMNEGFYLPLYSSVLPGFLSEVGKCRLQRSASTGKKIASKWIDRTLALWPGFLLGVADHFHGGKQRKKRSEPARKEACQGHVLLAEEVHEDDAFPVSKHFLWWPKLATTWTKPCTWYQLWVYWAGIYCLPSLFTLEMGLFGKQEWQRSQQCAVRWWHLWKEEQQMK